MKYYILKLNTPCIVLNKNINFNKNQAKSKMKNPKHTLLERRTLCFSSYKNRKLKIKMRWVGARERNKEHYLLRLYCQKGISLRFVLSRCIVYWIHFENICNFTSQKTFTVWKVSKYGVFSGPYFPVFSLNTRNYGPEKTPYLDTFCTGCTQVYYQLFGLCGSYYFADYFGPISWHNGNLSIKIYLC